MCTIEAKVSPFPHDEDRPVKLLFDPSIFQSLLRQSHLDCRNAKRDKTQDEKDLA